jgi:hypothetical protein
VARQINFNGMALQVQMLDSRLPQEEIEQFYQEYCQAKLERLPLNYPLGPWHVTAWKESHFFITLMLRSTDTSGTQGYLTVRDLLANRKTPLGSGFPAPGGSRFINDLVDLEPGRSARTLVFRNRMGINSHLNHFRNHFKAGDWALVDEKGDATRSHFMIWRRDREEVTLVFSRQEGYTHTAASIVHKQL